MRVVPGGLRALAAWVLAGAAASSMTGAAVIGVTVADASSGNYTLTSLTMSRGAAGTLTYLPSQLIGIDLTDVDAFQIPLLVPRGASLPAEGTRATLIEDGRLDTGVVNITTTNGSPDRSMELTFARPLVNSDGADLVLFEIDGNDGVRFWINNDRAGQSVDLTSYSGNLITGMPFSLFSYNNGGVQDVTSLETLEGSAGFNFNANSDGTIKGMELDLSALGVASGASISSIRLQSLTGGGRVDPVFVAALPAVPEPAGLAASAALVAWAGLRRRK